MTMDPIKRAALEWFKAEHGVNSDWENRLSLGDIYAEAVPRVKAVFAGEVRWSEASAGDKAVWRGRPRDISLVGAERHLRWGKVYDTITIAPTDLHRSWRMFGNTNVGNIGLTNLQCAGMPCFDAHFDVRQIYAEVDRDLGTADNVFVELRFGMRIIGVYKLRDLVIGCPVGQRLGVRQDMSVRIDWFGLAAPMTAVINLEGVEIPTGID